MFSTFSPWIALDDARREGILDDLRDIAETEFGGIVERPYLTSMFLAERLP